MLRLYSLIIGENPKYVATFQPSSKRKVALYANCILIPVIIWFINGYLLVSHVLDGNIWTALLTATIIALIIFIIERAVVMSNGNKWIAAFRITLGLIVAFIGSISLDEVVFKNDIDNQVASYKQAYIDDAIKNVEVRNKKSIALQQQIANQKSTEWIKSLTDAKGEADGTSGSRVANVGAITVLKMNIATAQKQDYLTEQLKLDFLKNSLEKERTTAIITAEKNFKGNAFLIRIRAMAELLGKDTFMLIVYVLFTAFLFLIEFLVVIIKLCSKNSIDEDLEKAREKLIRFKTQKTLDKGLLIYDPVQSLISVRKANNVVLDMPSSIFN